MAKKARKSQQNSRSGRRIGNNNYYAHLEDEAENARLKKERKKKKKKGGKAGTRMYDDFSAAPNAPIPRQTPHLPTLRRHFPPRKNKRTTRTTMNQLTAASKILPSSMTTQRFWFGAAVVNGKLFAVGGYGGGCNSIESCDVINGGQWTEAPSKMSQERGGCAAATIGNSVFVAGGAYGYYPLSSVEEFDVETGLWRSLPSMSTERCYCAAVAVGDELIVVGGLAGGYINSGRSLNTAESFNVRTGRWMDLPPMNNTRYYCAAAVINNKLYVVGGYDSETTSTLNTVKVFDLTTRRWTLLPHRMTTRREGCAAVAVGRYLLVVGGRDGTSSLNSVEVFDVDTKTWRECPPMTTKRSRCAAVSLGGSIFIMGGWDAMGREDRDDMSGRMLDSVEEISFNDDVIRDMLVECSGGSWRNDVMPLLPWRASVVHKLDIDIKSMPTLLSRVGGESRVQTVYEILRDEIGVFKHTPLT